jgi:hypothetical protein
MALEGSAAGFRANKNGKADSWSFDSMADHRSRLARMSSTSSGTASTSICDVMLRSD